MDGKTAEQLAKKHLQKAGLRIVAENYLCRRGEIDLIAKHNEWLVFIEVRYRSHAHFGSAADSIDARKQQRITTTAQNYLLEHKLGETLPCRFDTICLTPQQNGEVSIDWIQSAFGGY